jgi:aarF domain-containing kinase
VDGYLEIVWAAANKDRVSVLQVSRRLGFLSGDENEEMNAAHVDAALLLGEPFISSEPYDFGNSQLTTKIGDYGSTFMKYRLKPPPREAYSLHRKLAGAFLLCIKLKAKISCRDILESTHRHYDFT